MKYDLILFDLDGTLADTGADIAAALNHALRREGLAELPERRVIESIGGGIPVLLDRTIENVPADQRARIHTEVVAYYTEHLLDRTRLYPGVRETLEALRSLKAVVTNKPERMTVRLLSGLGVDKAFAAVYAGDTLPVTKPDPAAVRDALARFGVSPARALLVGDSGVDVETGRRAGVDMCAVTYGYSKPGELVGARYRIDQFQDLLGIVKV